MGHDISGYKPSNTENEIAYLRRGAFNELNGTIYNALNCQDCSGGVSGNGSEREFTKEQLEKGLAQLQGNDDFEPEIKFIKDCLDNLEDGKILIGFY